MGYVRLQVEPIVVERILAGLRGDAVGGVATYLGTVRGDDDGRRVEALDYEAYGEMARSKLEEIRSAAIQTFGLVDGVVVHRLGRLAPAEPILLIAMAGRHSREALEAVAFILQRLKREVPIWKREAATDGATWIVGEDRRRVKA